MIKCGGVGGGTPVAVEGVSLRQVQIHGHESGMHVLIGGGGGGGMRMRLLRRGAAVVQIRRRQRTSSVTGRLQHNHQWANDHHPTQTLENKISTKFSNFKIQIPQIKF